MTDHACAAPHREISPGSRHLLRGYWLLEQPGPDAGHVLDMRGRHVPF
jgi:hypothetical protein